MRHGIGNFVANLAERGIGGALFEERIARFESIAMNLLPSGET
jgi:hypothetical protein